MSVPNQRDPDLLEAVRALRAEVAELRASTVGRWGHGPQGLASQRPAAAADLDGVIYWATDTDTLSWCDGTGWIILAEPARTYSMAVTSEAGTITAVGTTSFVYRRSNGLLTFHATIAITAAGTAAGGLKATVPVGINAGYPTMVGSGREGNITGKMCQVYGYTTSQLAIYDYANSWPAPSGSNVLFNGCYPMTTRYS